MKEFAKLTKITLVLSGVLVFACCNSRRPIDISKLRETETDFLGLYKQSPNYAPMMEAGARIVNLEDRGTFFLVWVPDGYSQLTHKRVMVAVHGSEGTAYAEAQDELVMAREYGYAIVGVQWWLGHDEAYLEPSEVYDIIDIALRYMKFKYGSELNKVAYEGFSRGSSISYEVTFWDRKRHTKYFALTISHSGGMPPEAPTPFFQRLLAGDYGAAPFAHTHFFMYCGLKDEEWGPEQCRYMHNAKEIIERYGAKIERFIEDPEGAHGGYHGTPEYHRAAIRIFIKLTSF